MSHFLYIGQGLTANEFARYVAAYDFGSMPPTGVVLHHTAVPTFAQWTTPPNTYQSRKVRLDNIMRYYRDELGWSRGPHLFIDDQWVWLFTPMFHQGIHAANGNGQWIGNTLHYPIGIEVVGDYTRATWPEPVAKLVGHAIAVLQQRLGFALVHVHGNGTYASHTGTVSGHRDYNKPSCPGNAITEEYYLRVANDALQDMTDPEPAPPPQSGGTFVLKHPATVRRGTNRDAPIAATFHEIGDHIDILEWHTGQLVGDSDQWGLLSSPAYVGCFIHSSAFEGL